MRIILLFLSTISFLFAAFDNLSTFEADFKQILINDQKSKITYTGKLYADKNEKALWIYKTPVNKKIYYNQKSVVIIEPDLEQAIISKLDKVPNVLNILQNAKKIKKNIYEATCCKNRYKIYLKNNIISKITYKDKMQNQVEIIFLNQKVNKKISPSTFAYKIPQGYDILKE